MTNIFSTSNLKSLCKEYNLSPSKKYGQNYLISDTPIQKMIEAGELNIDDTVVEIGPGFGALTFAISPRVKKVVVFEIEKKLERYWNIQQQEYLNVDIVWGNALTNIMEFIRHDTGSYKVLANLPYQITSHAIRTLLELENKPERIVIMVQKEVAERICASTGDMSILAVSVQYYGTPEIVTHVEKENFWPSPKIDSVIVSIRGIQDRKNTVQFFRIVRAGFANKRKQLWRNLSVGLGLSAEHTKYALKNIVGNEKVRAEELSVENWIQLVEMFG